jgi:hypothetical protein
MRKPRKINPVGDLNDLDTVYEAEDHPIASLAVSYAEEAINDVAADVSAGGPGSVDIRSKKEVITDESKAEIELRNSGRKTQKSNTKPPPKSTPLLKDNHRPSSTRMSGRTKSGASRTIDKCRKSPDEYLKGK